MSWDEGLSPQQRTATKHTGTHARLLAGPGTGKTRTLTRHICFLIGELGVAANSVLTITFTRAAARELRQRVARELGENQDLRISTLHSFALRQLLRNSDRIPDLPQPLRIADDWEEENIVLKDLREILGLSRTEDVRNLLNQLSSDWQSLTVEEEGWKDRFPNPGFLGAWRDHRQVYAYTLRSELVYQLKKALEQRSDFELEGPVEKLLVDEYQDLNRCDLAVVKYIAKRGAELFVAGDDDQSIYGFRMAHPEGIRRFTNDFTGSKPLSLTICKRCDRNILSLGLFVAKQDPCRIDKDIRCEEGREEGEVFLLNFEDQYAEADGIADLCATLISRKDLLPQDIMILLRSDRNGLLSEPIQDKLSERGIESATTYANDPFKEDGRKLWAFLRLATDIDDSLAWRTVLETWCRGFGKQSILIMYNLARDRGETFAQTVAAVRADKDILPKSYQSRIPNAIGKVDDQLASMFTGEEDRQFTSPDELMMVIRAAASCFFSDSDECTIAIQYFDKVARELEELSLEKLVNSVGTTNDEIEQETEENKVNISTMHRAKGLTAKAVILAVAEDEYIPGRSIAEPEFGDERRLLYVSLTRPEHYLFITYCDKRTGKQKYTGRKNGTEFRSLTRFLRDCSHSPEYGPAFVSKYKTESHRL